MKIFILLFFFPTFHSTHRIAHFLYGSYTKARVKSVFSLLVIIHVVTKLEVSYINIPSISPYITQCNEVSKELEEVEKCEIERKFMYIYIHLCMYTVIVYIFMHMSFHFFLILSLFFLHPFLPFSHSLCHSFDNPLWRIQVLFLHSLLCVVIYVHIF